MKARAGCGNPLSRHSAKRRGTSILDSETANQLSNRQAEIANLVVGGRTTREIALGLGLSDRTVETHIAAIFNKLGVRSRVELVRALLHSGTGEQRAETPARKTNLPHRLPALVGRDELLVEVSEALRGHGLVSLVGPGGAGKTQLALRLGAAQFDAGFEVWFADLSTATEPSLVASTVAGALGVRDNGTRPLVDELIASLGRRKLLLIVDNCEHVVHAAAELVKALLGGAPETLIIATSREPLRVPGERVYPVAPLSESDAVTLFVQRARAVDPRFERDPRRDLAVARICRAVDCLPLAIEFAAARTNLLSVDALADRLEQRLSILAVSDRTAASRHRNLEALVDWSYELLSDDERRLFERLSIFSGGGSLSAVLEVGAREGLSEDELLGLLGSLVDKSLAFTNVGAGEPRYRLLETTRRYARAKLVAGGTLNEAARRHAEAYANVAEEMDRSWAAGATHAWIERAEAELPNMRAALVWTLQEREAVALGQRLAAASRYAWISLAYPEGGRWVQLALAEVDRSTPDDIVATLALAEAQFASGVAKYKEALEASLRALRLFRKVDDSLGVARAAGHAGRLLTLFNRDDEAEPLLEEALAVARSLGVRGPTAGVLESLGRVRAARGRIADTRAMFGEAIALYRAMGADRTAVLAALQLAEAESRAGDSEAALATVRLALDESRALGPAYPGVDGLSSMAFAEGLSNMSAYLVSLDRFHEAYAIAKDALASLRAHERGQPVWAIQHLAAIAALGPHADPLRAGRLCGFVDARLAEREMVRSSLGTEEREYQRLRQRLERDLDPVALRLAIETGATWNEERAIAEALLVEP